MNLTTEEFAKKANLTRGRIYHFIWDGVIKAQKHGRDYLIDESQLEIIRHRPDRRGRWERTEKTA